jgi:Kef-type K+ transport system membrane component KefB
MEILAIVPIILIAAFLLGEFFKRLGLPSVVGQILAGLLFGIPFIKEQFIGESSTLVIIDFLATLGILLLLFLAGLEIEIEKDKRNFTGLDSDFTVFSNCSVYVGLHFHYDSIPTIRGHGRHNLRRSPDGYL